MPSARQQTIVQCNGELVAQQIGKGFCMPMLAGTPLKTRARARLACVPVAVMQALSSTSRSTPRGGMLTKVGAGQRVKASIVLSNASTASCPVWVLTISPWQVRCSTAGPFSRALFNATRRWNALRFDTPAAVYQRGADGFHLIIEVEAIALALVGRFHPPTGQRPGRQSSMRRCRSQAAHRALPCAASPP